VGEADAETALRETERLDPDVLLLDIVLPDRSGLDSR
jgi:DNA-binding response OmpR family regulator